VVPLYSTDLACFPLLTSFSCATFLTLVAPICALRVCARSPFPGMQLCLSHRCFRSRQVSLSQDRGAWAVSLLVFAAEFCSDAEHSLRDIAPSPGNAEEYAYIADALYSIRWRLPYPFRPQAKGPGKSQQPADERIRIMASVQHGAGAASSLLDAPLPKIPWGSPIAACPLFPW